MTSCKDCLCGDVCSIAEVMGENFCCPDCVKHYGMKYIRNKFKERENI